MDNNIENNNNAWIEVNDSGVMIKWKNFGQEETGNLESIDNASDAKDTSSGTYVLDTAQGRRWGYLLVDLRRKLKNVPIGAQVSIKYTNDLPLKKGSMKMKQFSVKYQPPDPKVPVEDPAK